MMRRSRNRRHRWRQDRGSLPMAILVAVVGIGLASALLPMVVMQISQTTFATTRGQSLHAAQTGLETAIAEIRAATTDGDGDRAKLPCGPITGPAGDTGSTFSVGIVYYYAGDPSLHDADWQRDHAMLCVESAGPYDPPSGSGTPSFALLTSTGTSPNEVRSRVLQETYIVKTSNRNIVGGAIPLFPKAGSANHYCMDAGTPIAAGNAVGVLPCPTDPSRIPDQQKWAYTPNLTLQLTTTVGNTDLNPNGTGLCLGTQQRTHSVGALLVVEPCRTVAGPGANAGKAIWQQVWSINSDGHFEGSLSDYSDLDGYCLYAPDQPAVQLKLDQNCGSGTTDPLRAWNPMPSVGAGQAGAANNQLVNFAQFGRCLDVTNNSADGGDNGGTFLILYPCKQNPNTARLDLNQIWEAIPVGSGNTVQWRTHVHNDKKQAVCLTSPQTATGYVYAAPCSSPVATNQRWTALSDVDSEGNQLSYADKYVTKDSAGLCLSASPDEYNGNPKVAVDTCQGRTDQKWNADPNVSSTSVVRLHEITGQTQEP